MSTVFIAVGSNLSDPVSQANAAIDALKQLPKSEFIRSSSLYSSTPMGPQDQPDYVNAVSLVETELSAHELFTHTCQIEQDHGRVRNGEHWGPRTLDLDILLFGDHKINDEQLVIPHYGMKEREFVIYPLLDISPDLVLPCGTHLQQLTQSVPLNGMETIK